MVVVTNIGACGTFYKRNGINSLKFPPKVKHEICFIHIDSVPFCLLEEQEQMPLLLASLHTSSQTDLPFSVYEVYVCWRVPRKSILLRS